MRVKFQRLRAQGAPLRAALLLTVAALSQPVQAFAATTAAAATSPSEKAQTYTFAFHDADISLVATEILGKALGLTYTIDPGVTGKMSFQIDKQLTGPQLLEAFEAVLEDSQVSLVRDGDALAVKPRAKAKTATTVRALSDGVHGAGYQTLAVPLDFAAPSEVGKALQAVTSQDIVVHVDDKLGLLILGGNEGQLQSAVETVHLFDHNGFQGAKIRFFDLQQAAAQVVYADLIKIIEASKITGVTAVPLKRLNGLFVIAQSPAALTEVGNWITKLDVPSKERTLSLWVYHPRNLSADTLSQALAGVVGSSGSLGQSSLGPPPSSALGGGGSQTGSGGLSGGGFSTSGGGVSSNVSTEDDPVRIGIDKQTNTLLFSASQAHWIQLQKTLNELDRTPSQVLIEASILEVTLGNQFNYGVDWAVLGDAGKISINSVNSADGKVGSPVPGFQITFLQKDIQAAISALRQRTSVEVISAPKIVALDNHPAKLEVGDDVPITTQAQQSTSANSAPVLNSVSYRSTGVILNVTPRIAGDGKVLLDISQEVSSVAQTTSSNINSPTIQQRKVSTSLMLENGGTIALGGLISGSKNLTDNGVPYVEAIPIIGALFKTHTNTRTRTELIVLIKATIVQDKQSSEKATAALLADMNEIKIHGLVER